MQRQGVERGYFPPSRVHMCIWKAAEHKHTNVCKALRRHRDGVAKRPVVLICNDSARLFCETTRISNFMPVYLSRTRPPDCSHTSSPTSKSYAVPLPASKCLLPVCPRC